MTTLQDRVAGGLWGMLVGDALGVPYEFHAPESIPPADRIEYTPPDDFRRAHRGTPPGTWSDDGAQALCLLASLLERGRLDLADLGRRLTAWANQGYLAVDGRVFDIGIQTTTAVARLAAGASPHTAGPDDVRSNGNGALMRVLPLALWHRGGDGALVHDAHLQGLPTHGHVRSQVCCALYCLWARNLLHTPETRAAWSLAAETLRAIYAAEGLDTHRWELEEEVLPGLLPTGTGYVLDTLHSARLVLNRDEDYAATVRAAIRLGHDTDTTACVAGGLAGIRGGVGDIPARWRAALRGQALLTPLLEGLLAHASPR